MSPAQTDISSHEERVTSASLLPPQTLLLCLSPKLLRQSCDEGHITVKAVLKCLIFYFSNILLLMSCVFLFICRLMMLEQPNFLPLTHIPFRLDWNILFFFRKIKASDTKLFVIDSHSFVPLSLDTW